jgi:photosynthetic reaction center cytochrome c subunit
MKRPGPRTRAALGTTAALWLLGVVAMMAAPGQAPTAGDPSRPQLADQVFKNVQILKGIPVDEFMTTMGFFSASLGLNCTDCHVDESGGSWERYADDNDLKRTSRRMMLMVQTINRTNFGGRQVVTCNTCHRGSYRPNVMPSLNLLYGEPPPDEPGDPIAQAPGQPPAAQLLDKYVAAGGGPLTSLSAKGTYIAFDDADKSPLELYVTAQGQRALVAHVPAGDTSWILNGTNAWIAAPPTDRPIPVMAITGQELEGVAVEAQAFFPARVRQLLRNWRVGTPALLDGREVHVLQGDTAAGAVVTLCIDAETNLLTRLVRYSDSPVGRLVTRVDYSGYRDAGGVKIPTKWTVSWLSGRSTFELAELQPNARVDPARFAMPAAPAARRTN